MAQRKTNRNGQAGAATALENIYNDYAGAFKHMNVFGLLQLPGRAANASTEFLPGQTIAFFNSDTSVHYVALGVSSVSAPTNPTNGIPIPPGQYLVTGTGDNKYYQSDSATVYAYIVADDTLRNGSDGND